MTLPTLAGAPTLSDPTPTSPNPEQLLTELSPGLLGPRARKCLLCYVQRMITESAATVG